MIPPEQFAVVTAYLSAAVGKPMSAEQTEVYYDLLGDLPLPALQLATRQALLESRYPTIPTPGALRQIALALLRPAPFQAMEAWELVLRAVNRFGLSGMARALATLPEPARGAARALGWGSLCDLTLEQMPTVRAQFRDAYTQLAARGEQEALPPARYQQQARELLEGLVKDMSHEQSERPMLPLRPASLGGRGA
jgi:hypothetical protein